MTRESLGDVNAEPGNGTQGGNGDGRGDTGQPVQCSIAAQGCRTAPLRRALLSDRCHGSRVRTDPDAHMKSEGLRLKIR